MDGDKRILAIETSGRRGSVATLWGNTNDSHLIQEAAISNDQRTAQALAPTMQALLKDTDWSPSSVELVCVAVGPGSFTGLRIGVTAAKAFAYSVRAEVVAVNTSEVLASQAPKSGAPLWTILDAQRQELFAAKFVMGQENVLRLDRETSIVSQDAWLAGLQPGETVTGTGLERLADRLPPGITALSKELWQPMAAAVGHIGWRAFQSGCRDDIWQLV
ncbi:MAG TPA: tRNA (adenosine(37)-N6)-threonylcarbamoyltransferase complex dimerization subunit type 1 TsaB, partial [Lacipirellulaceae bacterium]|nr:tRNA (adenosine(37)-N6)-threonylcarbamoyltransferase complex dimerization subunit type 1 TsaB [Lacipirellulaceae bacterium]